MKERTKRSIFDRYIWTIRDMWILPADIPSIEEIGSPMDDGLPRWREVKEAVHCARAASRKWLGMPHCPSTVALYVKGIK